MSPAVCVAKAHIRAHKAANPSAYPVREDVKAMMPHWADIDGKHPPTDVHLQVYDGEL